MATIRAMSLTALVTVLVGGVPPLAGAQQTYGTSPTQGSPAPSSTYGSPQEYSPGGAIQLYSWPAGSTAGTPPIPPTPPVPPAPATPPMPSVPATPPTPAVPPQPNPYAAPEPMPRARYEEYPQAPDSEYPQYRDDAAGPDWSPPGGSIQIQDYRGVRYVSGGIGEGERAELNALSDQFNLRLLFAMHGSGDYLADIRVRILNSRGEVVLNAESNGPWFLAELPAGTYTVEVVALDQIQRQIARLDGSRQTRLNFYWR